MVGRDTRPSGESFAAFSASVPSRRRGRDVIDLGIATTPTVEIVTERTDAVAGIIVTASHNPIEWNALKFLDHRGIFITKDMGAKLHAAYKEGRVLVRGREEHGEDHGLHNRGASNTSTPFSPSM